MTSRKARPRTTADPLHATTDRIRCELCGKWFKAISHFHLRHKHGWEDEHPVDGYKERYGLVVACSQESREKLSESRIAWWDRNGRKWSPSQVLDVIHRHAANGNPLHAGALARPGLYGLYIAARRFFGSWDEAARRAGIRGSLRLHLSWTRGGVLDAIRARLRDGKPVYYAAVHRDNDRLVAAGRWNFGTWIEALKAAGVPPKLRRAPVVHPTWPLERVLAIIRARVKAGKPVNPGAMLRDCRQVYDAGQMNLGGWKRLLKKAWVPRRLWSVPNGVSKWTPESVIVAIRRRFKSGKPVYWKAIWNDAPELFRAAVLHLGNWGNALRAAKIPYSARRAPLTNRPRLWSREQVIKTIRNDYGAGRPVYAKAVRRRQGSLYTTARTYVGSWQAALEAAGIPRSTRNAPRHGEQRTRRRCNPAGGIGPRV